MNQKIMRFRRMALVTIFLTIFLIWVGGWVRSVGAGMGCPDWPKCFGQLVPPTDVSQLPTDYKQIYAEKRRKKNERIATRLEKMGFVEVAQKIRGDEKTYIEEDFNAYKTWTEYVNRLVGVLVGFAIFLTMVYAFPLRKIAWQIPVLSVIGFLLVLLEGWLGSIVVSTNLMPGTITIHMVLAMVLLMVLIVAYLSLTKHLATETTEGGGIALPRPLFGLGWLISLMILWQIGVGTQVRERVDAVADAMGEAGRGQWLANLGSVYDWHQYSFYFVAGAILVWAYLIGNQNFGNRIWVKRFTIVTVSLLFIEVILGIAMHNLGLPAVLQPLHLLFGSVLFAASFTLTTLLKD
jgi:cytochrome c oxidase assembly protein subunit 15